MPDHHTRTRHLRPVHDVPAVRQSHRQADSPPSMAPRTTERPVKLTATQRYEVEEAREYIDGLGDVDAAELTPAQFGYVIGRTHGYANNLLNIIDAITDL